MRAGRPGNKRENRVGPRHFAEPRSPGATAEAYQSHPSLLMSVVAARLERAGSSRRTRAARASTPHPSLAETPTDKLVTPRPQIRTRSPSARPRRCKAPRCAFDGPLDRSQARPRPAQLRKPKRTGSSGPPSLPRQPRLRALALDTLGVGRPWLGWTPVPGPTHTRVVDRRGTRLRWVIRGSPAGSWRRTTSRSNIATITMRPKMPIPAPNARTATPSPASDPTTLQHRARRVERGGGSPFMGRA
jgi:hypothetical protein